LEPQGNDGRQKLTAKHAPRLHDEQATEWRTSLSVIGYNGLLAVLTDVIFEVSIQMILDWKVVDGGGGISNVMKRGMGQEMGGRHYPSWGISYRRLYLNHDCYLGYVLH
jgi:hypothetical protein